MTAYDRVTAATVVVIVLALCAVGWLIGGHPARQCEKLGGHMKQSGHVFMYDPATKVGRHMPQFKCVVDR